MTITFDDLVAPVTDLGEDFDTAISPWSWLIARPARPILMSVLGDLFLEIDGAVYLLDSEGGTLREVAPSVADWKRQMQEPRRIGEWFLPRFVEALLERGERLKGGEVYSPVIPPVLGGKYTVENFTPSNWRMHLHVLGQIHEQVRDLPPGTPIDQIKIEPF